MRDSMKRIKRYLKRLDSGIKGFQPLLPFELYFSQPADGKCSFIRGVIVEVNGIAVFIYFFP